MFALRYVYDEVDDDLDEDSVISAFINQLCACSRAKQAAASESKAEGKADARKLKAEPTVKEKTDAGEPEVEEEVVEEDTRAAVVNVIEDTSV